MYYVKRQIFQPGLGIFGLCTVSCLLTVYKGRVDWSCLNVWPLFFGRPGRIISSDVGNTWERTKENAAQYIYRSLLERNKDLLLGLLCTVIFFSFCNSPHLEQSRLMKIQLTCRLPLGKILCTTENIKTISEWPRKGVRLDVVIKHLNKRGWEMSPNPKSVTGG
jgi:hypothetical protein